MNVLQVAAFIFFAIIVKSDQTWQKAGCHKIGEI
jgi:hypothetical protein